MNSHKDVQENILASLGLGRQSQRSTKRGRSASPVRHRNKGQSPSRSRSRSPRARPSRPDSPRPIYHRPETNPVHQREDADLSTLIQNEQPKDLFSLPLYQIRPHHRDGIRQLCTKLNACVGGSFVSDAEAAYQCNTDGIIKVQWRCTKSQISLYRLEKTVFCVVRDLVVVNWSLSRSILKIDLCMRSEMAALKKRPCAMFCVSARWSADDRHQINHKELRINYDTQALPYVRKECKQYNLVMKEDEMQQLAWCIAHLAARIYDVMKDNGDYSVLLSTPTTHGPAYPRVVCGPFACIQSSFVIKISEGLARMDPMLMTDTECIHFLCTPPAL
jgi:hypothetical protein